MTSAPKMMSPKKDCEPLLQEMLRFAKEMLTKHAEFHPFGGMIRNDGSVVHLSAQVVDECHPRPEQLILLLRERIRHEIHLGRIIASAVVFNVGNIRDPQSGFITDAIQICLDHIENYTVEVLVPYNTGLLSIPVYGRPFAQQGDGKLFN